MAKQFLEAEHKRDFKAMKELSTDDSQKMIELLERVMANDTTKHIDTNAINITNTELKDTTAICAYCCNPDGNASTIHLRKTDKGWKVDMSKETLMNGKDIKKSIKNASDSTGGVIQLNPTPEQTIDSTK